MNEALATGVVGELLGRARECAAIERLLAQARRGEGAAVVIRGEAGIGKTALLELALGQSGTMTVLHVTGVEAERIWRSRACLGCSGRFSRG